MKNGIKIKVDLSIRKNVWKKYQQFCKDNDLIPSFRIQEFMILEMSKGD